MQEAIAGTHREQCNWANRTSRREKAQYLTNKTRLVFQYVHFCKNLAMTNDYFLNCLLTFLTGDPGYDLDTKGGGEGGAGGGAFPEVGTDGKALTGLI